MRGTCPDCDGLWEVTPTGEPVVRNGKKIEGQRYWQLVVHPHNGRVCDGSGKKI